MNNKRAIEILNEYPEDVQNAIMDVFLCEYIDQSEAYANSENKYKKHIKDFYDKIGCPGLLTEDPTDDDIERGEDAGYDLTYGTKWGDYVSKFDLVQYS